VSITAQHTTTSVFLNEHESFLAQDLITWCEKAVPETDSYKHNDITSRPSNRDEELRIIENGFDITNPIELQKWRDGEPINAHAHILASIFGNGVSLGFANSTLQIGKWNSCLFADFDPGPKTRRIRLTFLS